MSNTPQVGFVVTHDPYRITISLPDDFLVNASESLLTIVETMLGSALRRQRNQELCERDGHQPDGSEAICARCHLVLDPEKWNALRAEVTIG